MPSFTTALKNPKLADIKNNGYPRRNKQVANTCERLYAFQDGQADRNTEERVTCGRDGPSP